MTWWRRGSPERVPDPVPHTQCKYCKTPHKWRMSIRGYVIHVCARHVDEALDEYLEVKRHGEIPGR